MTNQHQITRFSFSEHYIMMNNWVLFLAGTVKIPPRVEDSTPCVNLINYTKIIFKYIPIKETKMYMVIVYPMTINFIKKHIYFPVIDLIQLNNK